VIYRVESLRVQDLGGFSCGNAELDRWLRRHSGSAIGQGIRAYLLIGHDGLVRGFFAVSPHLLMRDDAPCRLARGARTEIRPFCSSNLRWTHRSVDGVWDASCWSARSKRSWPPLGMSWP
jgi:hypothetical protein